ncbi:lysine decarboxylase, putative [Eimeria necatrix]|uniref:Lysine decarboxylase, putative n=1 Tax=Eimeria necatrix TaxID=51315 RepID=U6MKZ3_9EIME|nr:lysine decarboxylase, putative [Eimeria necatrix]CDJ63743.1 lysine decarboxylase, putative [Eimeria necatrix]
MEEQRLFSSGSRWSIDGHGASPLPLSSFRGETIEAEPPIILERRSTIETGAERRVSQLSTSQGGTNGPLGTKHFDVDSLVRSGGSAHRSGVSGAATPAPPFPLKCSDTTEAPAPVFRGDTFACTTEDFLTSDTTYVAQLREELWQALAAHVAARTLQKVDAALDCLEEIEWFWGKECVEEVHSVRSSLKDGKFDCASSTISRVVGSMSSVTGSMSGRQHVFYVLVVVPPCTYLKTDHRLNLASELRRISSTESIEGDLAYRIVEVDTIRRALLAVIVNPEILAVCIQDNVPVEHSTARSLSGLEGFVRGIDRFVEGPIGKMKLGAPVIPTLVRSLHQCRRALDIYCVCTGLGLASLEHVDHLVKRAFLPNDDHSDLHEAILEGVRSKMRCPFFEALRHYAERPIGVFHALAVSRGNSVRRSKWIQFLIDFYGTALFKAESSATCGGLDSLLDPHGSLLEAQTLAARAFDASYAFFVTNGTSTSNKIVVQALTRPNDVVLIDRDCHKSHHYALVLAGARPCYLDAYPLHEYSMYGGVTLTDIKKTLLGYRSAGRLNDVRLLVITNCTFDGIVYNVKRLMEECLAIKPDLVFLFDEAWFAYAGFHPILKTRTAMHCANELRRELMERKYHHLHTALLNTLKVSSLEEASAASLLSHRLYPNPHKVKVRVYATQSTHKSLTSLRQGSMVLVNDDLFESHVHTSFKESYYTHMSTSPNYQILATLDVGRSQMELEGYGLVERQLEAAFLIRNALGKDPFVSKYFKILGPHDMIPASLRQCSVQENCLNGLIDEQMNVQTLEEVWLSDDEFVLDPTRITLYTGKSGLDGDTFKVKWLMDKYGIQINKTSRNSVLFMTNIGTTRSSCVFLRSCIRHCAQELEMRRLLSSRRELEELEQQIDWIVHDCPALPNFSGFHPAFSQVPLQPMSTKIGSSDKQRGDGTPVESPRSVDHGSSDSSSTHCEACIRDGDVREPFYLSYDEENVEYYSLKEAIELIRNGRILVGSTFIIPYPPGFPISVPGQILSEAIVEFMIKIDVKEIHGFDPKLGLRCFKESLLENLMEAREVHEPTLRTESPQQRSENKYYGN